MGFFNTIKKPHSPYPQTYIGYPEDQDDWSGYQFINYFESNRKLVGQAQASMYVRADIAQVHLFADIYDSDFDCYVVEYFSNEIGVDYPNPFSYTYCGIESVIVESGRVAANIGKFATTITHPATLIVLGLGLAAAATYPSWKGYLKIKKLKKRG